MQCKVFLICMFFVAVIIDEFAVSGTKFVNIRNMLCFSRSRSYPFNLKTKISANKT